MAVNANEGAFSPTLNNPAARTSWAARTGTSSARSAIHTFFITPPSTRKEVMAYSLLWLPERLDSHAVLVARAICHKLFALLCTLSYHADFFRGNGAEPHRAATVPE